jgi:hypothetical protein
MLIMAQAVAREENFELGRFGAGADTGIFGFRRPDTPPHDVSAGRTKIYFVRNLYGLLLGHDGVDDVHAVARMRREDDVGQVEREPASDHQAAVSSA